MAERSPAIIAIIKEQLDCGISYLTGDRYMKYVIIVFSNNPGLIFDNAELLSLEMWKDITYNLAKRNAILSAHINEKKIMRLL